MANYIQVQNPTKVVAKVANNDYLWGPYSSIQNAQEILGVNGEDKIVGGRHFGVTNPDGTVDDYMFTKTDDPTKYMKTNGISEPISILVLTQAEYDAMETKDENTLYLIKE